jgi:large subunit ribosomal protein L35
MKTHSGAKKRMKITCTGKIRVSGANRKHLLQNKTKAAKQRNMHGKNIHANDVKRAKTALGL